jgi:subtilisin family serine protease
LIGAGDGNTGMLGFACGADLWAIQGQVQDGSVDNTSWAKAIETARLTSSGGKRKVILVEVSTSDGLNVESSTTLRVPIMQAIADNCVVCVTAGNIGVDAGLDENFDPFPETGSILVGATLYKNDPTNILRSDSNWGSRVVVSAPGATGTDVTCCDCGIDRYRNEFGGTSGAAAKVAGAMALVLQKFPEVTHQQIVEVLKTKMPQITTTDHPMGCFLDVEELMVQVAKYLSEH